jgi:Holliday junction DNA helicase RuvA
LIGRLSGKLLTKQPPQVLVDVGGVAYELDVPMSTFYELPATGEAVSLYTHLVVREDAHTLYGFVTLEERSTFRQLIRISGIGARTALAVLSGMSVGDLRDAVSRQDGARLTKIPGIGKKTAERIVLELRDRLMQLVAPAAAGAAPIVSAADRFRADLLSALQNLGYHRQQAEKAIDAVVTSAPEATFEQALRGALRELMR